MEHTRLLSFIVFLLTAIPSFGGCPTIPLRTFDKERGFNHVMAYKDDKTGMTNFHIKVDPKTFLSHFKHAFPANRGQTRITLRANNTKDFKGVTVDFGRVNYGDPEFEMTFDVPSTDLSHYELEFDCSISWGEGNVPVIGGEINVASLRAFRDANDTVTESNPIWKRLEEEHQKMIQQGNFGSGSRWSTKKSAQTESGPRE